MRDLSPSGIYFDWEGQYGIDVKDFGIKIGSQARIPAIVIDGNKWHVDSQVYDVPVTEKTYEDLAEMKFIYDFEKSYSYSAKAEASLKDARKLDRKQYLRWIEILKNNKTSGIRPVKSQKRRKIIGEAWILNGNYGASTKENMKKNLAYLKSKGYDTVLVRFRCSEDIN